MTLKEANKIVELFKIKTINKTDEYIYPSFSFLKESFVLSRWIKDNKYSLQFIKVEPISIKLYYNNSILESDDFNICKCFIDSWKI